MRATQKGVSYAKRAAATALLAGVIGLTAACGEDAEQATEPAKPTESSAAPTSKAKPKDVEEKAVIAVIGRFHKYVDSGDGKRACALMTKDLKWVFSQNPGAGTCVRGVKWQHKELDGTKLSKTKFHAGDVTIRKKGKEAVIDGADSAKHNGGATVATYDLVKRGGKWKLDYVS